MANPTSPIEEGRSASYRMEQLDATAEVARLEAQVRLVTPLEDDFLAAAGLAKDAWLLDVGCGPGFFSERAARQLVPEGRVTGVDVDPSLLALGRERLAGSELRIDFVEGTGVRLPLPDDSVDFAYARFVMQHLSDPVSVLREMVRVTRPGGRVGLVDTDDGALLLHPDVDGFDRLLEASLLAQRDRGGDRHVGRKLKALLLEAGALSPTVRLYPFTSEQVGPTDFLRVTTGFKAGVLGPPWITPEQLAAVGAALEVASADPGFFGQAMGYAAYATVPPR
jgi:SAM-dependent methyltransferase